MCRDKTNRKEYQQVKHGPSDQTRPGTTSQNLYEESGYHEHECEATRPHRSPVIWQSLGVYHVNVEDGPTPSPSCN